MSSHIFPQHLSQTHQRIRVGSMPCLKKCTHTKPSQQSTPCNQQHGAQFGRLDVCNVGDTRQSFSVKDDDSILHIHHLVRIASLRNMDIEWRVGPDRGRFLGRVYCLTNVQNGVRTSPLRWSHFGSSHFHPRHADNFESLLQCWLIRWDRALRRARGNVVANGCPRGSPCRGTLSLGPQEIQRLRILLSVCVGQDLPKTHELPDGNIITIGARRFRCAVVLFHPKSYDHPDGNIITVGTKRFRCAEVLFNPKTYELPDGKNHRQTLPLRGSVVPPQGLRAPRRKHHNCWRHTLPLARKCCSSPRPPSSQTEAS